MLCGGSLRKEEKKVRAVLMGENPTHCCNPVRRCLPKTSHLAIKQAGIAKPGRFEYKSFVFILYEELSMHVFFLNSHIAKNSKHLFISFQIKDIFTY